MRRVLLVLAVAALMAAMLATTAGTAFAQVERGKCLPGIPCRQGVLLPDDPIGNVYDGKFGQASSACPAVVKTIDELRPPGTPKGEEASDNLTIAFFHCFEGPEPIE